MCWGVCVCVCGGGVCVCEYFSGHCIPETDVPCVCNKEAV